MIHYLQVWHTPCSVAPKNFRQGVCWVVAVDEEHMRELVRDQAHLELERAEVPQVAVQLAETRVLGAHVMGVESEGVLESLIW